MSIPEVAFIAVDKRFQGVGIGGQLIGFVTENECYGGVFISTVTSSFVAKRIYEKKYDAQIIKTFSVLNSKYWQLRWGS